MWKIFHKILKGIGWAIVVMFLLSTILVNIFMTLVLHYKGWIPSRIESGYLLISNILSLAFILFLIIFITLEYRGKLPTFYFKETFIIKYPVFILSRRRIVKALIWWLCIGIVPVFAIICYLAMQSSCERFLVFGPGIGLYLEIALLFILYKHIIVTRPS